MGLISVRSDGKWSEAGTPSWPLHPPCPDALTDSNQTDERLEKACTQEEFFSVRLYGRLLAMCQNECEMISEE